MITHLDLCTGIGGFKLGAQQAGITTRGFAEVDPFCSRLLKHYWPGIPNLGDIRHITGKRVVEQFGFIDVVTGGWPCQDLSIAGKRAGLAGSRSGLFFDIVRICREIREAQDGAVVLVGENVKGALSSNGGADWGNVLDTLAESGCVELGWRVLDSRYWGLAQRRERVFLVASFGETGASEILLDGSCMPRNPKARSVTKEASTQDIAGCLGGGSGSRGWCSDTDRMTFVPDLSPALKARDHKGARPEASGAALIGFYHTNRQPEWGNYENISPTLKIGSGSGGEPTSVAGHFGVRRLTPTELERLQGFPDGYTNIPGAADGPRYRALGNAVSVPVVAWIMRNLHLQLSPHLGKYGI